MIERERLLEERDGLRYYVEEDDGKAKSENDILFQRWFHCKDLGKELGPIIKTYFASEQHKTGICVHKCSGLWHRGIGRPLIFAFFDTSIFDTSLV